MKNISTDVRQMSRRTIEVLRPKLGKSEAIVTALICILVASGLGYIYYTEISRVRGDIVGIIRVEGYIEDPSTVDRYTDIINQAILNESIKAVVLIIDSGGGYADYIEQIYLDLLVLKEKKPLAASIISALSGGYYIAVAADDIYVNPTSFVGNIGVIGVGPPVLIPSEQVMETGAYKVTGFSKLLFPYNLSHALDNFVSAVEKGRGDRLKLSATQLKRAMIYLGSEAVDAGLADGIGSLQNATERVAEEAGLVRFEVSELRESSTYASWRGSSNNTSVDWKNLSMETLNMLHPPPTIHYIYLPPETLPQGSSSLKTFAATADIPAGKGLVLVDTTHGNMISWWVLNIFIAELAKANVTVSFISHWENLESMLDNASCLIVASPTETYSAEECNRIESFVDKGRIALLFFDPSWEYIGTQGLLADIIAPINSLSTRFGLSFAEGYLYNEVEHFGIYRNIYVRNFASSPLVQNIRSLALFTATHIYSMDKGVAWTSNNTYSSVAEKADNYATIVWVERGNGAIAAFGDLTFLSEPYCYVEDNYKLILNLVSLITRIRVPAKERVEEGVKEEVARPDLPVGTEKNYTEQVDGEEDLVKWFKVSETEVRVERPNRTAHYYFNEEGALWKWESDGMECIYEDPLPEPPYPLTKRESWKYESNYTLTVEGKEYNGKIMGEEEVEGFGDVTAGDNKTYFCAEVRYTQVEQLTIDGKNMTMITTGRYWVSSDVDTVKEEAGTRYFVDGTFAGEERRTLLLKSIRKGQGT